MKKKITTYILSGILITAFIYSLLTTFIDKNKNIDPTIFLNSSSKLEPTSLLNEESLTEDDDGGNIEYRIVDESEFELFEGENVAGASEEHGHAHEVDDEEMEVLAINRKAPDFELQTMEGELVKLSNYKGEKIFINFWATWCPPCVKEMPEIQHYFEELQTDDVILLSVNTTDVESNRESVQDFAELHNIHFPILLDEEGVVSAEYGIITIPTSFIVNEEGVIVEEIIGPVTEKFLSQKFGH